jgi:hypothetical protein
MHAVLVGQTFPGMFVQCRLHLHSTGLARFDFVLIFVHPSLHLVRAALVICQSLYCSGRDWDCTARKDPVRHQASHTVRYAEPLTKLDFSQARVATESDPIVKLKIEVVRYVWRLSRDNLQWGSTLGIL